jgi:hypothetical protein
MRLFCLIHEKKLEFERNVCKENNRKIVKKIKNYIVFGEKINFMIKRLDVMPYCTSACIFLNYY